MGGCLVSAAGVSELLLTGIDQWTDCPVATSPVEIAPDAGYVEGSTLKVWQHPLQGTSYYNGC